MAGALIWWFVLNLIILNTRPSRSAKAYSKIWTDEGSPLDTITRSLVKKLNNELNEDIEVFTAMRYGNHSISDFGMRISDLRYSVLFPS